MFAGAKVVQIERKTKFIWIFPRCSLLSNLFKVTKYLSKNGVYMRIPCQKNKNVRSSLQFLLFFLVYLMEF